jgi:hypothetical protein
MKVAALSTGHMGKLAQGLSVRYNRLVAQWFDVFGTTANWAS